MIHSGQEGVTVLLLCYVYSSCDHKRLIIICSEYYCRDTKLLFNGTISIWLNVKQTRFEIACSIIGLTNIWIYSLFFKCCFDDRLTDDYYQHTKWTLTVFLIKLLNFEIPSVFHSMYLQMNMMHAIYFIFKEHLGKHKNLLYTMMNESFQ